MIVYNVTVNIEDSVHDEWLSWMKSKHIPDVMKSGCFMENKIFKILGDEESGGTTYSIQYSCDNMDKFLQYEQKFAPAFRNEFNEKYKDKVVSFRTLLEKVD